MKSNSYMELLVVSIIILCSCKSSQLQSTAKKDQFLFVVLKSDPDVVEGLLTSCACMEVVRMEILNTEPVIINFSNKRSAHAVTIRLLIKIKAENQTAVKNELSAMQDVISVDFIR